jgi:transketolase
MPQLIILDTIKGKDFSFAENTAAYHNGIFTQELHDKALAELDAIKKRI